MTAKIIHFSIDLQTDQSSYYNITIQSLYQIRLFSQTLLLGLVKVKVQSKKRKPCYPEAIPVRIEWSLFSEWDELTLFF